MRGIVLAVVSITVVCLLLTILFGREETLPSQTPPPDGAADPAVNSPGQTESRVLDGGADTSHGTPPENAAERDGSPQRIESGLAALRGTVPPGDPSEWAAGRLDGSQWYLPSWLSDVVTSTVGDVTVRLEEPPYNARLVFGASDREWFRRFEKSFYKDLDEALRVSGVDRMDSRYNLQVDQVNAEVQERYAALLREEAVRRVAGVEDLMKRFRDTRSARDFLPDSDERKWLEHYIKIVVPHWLWKGYADYPMAEEDLQHLSAEDLRGVARWRAEARRSLTVPDPTTGCYWKHEDAPRVLGPYAQRLFRLILRKSGRSD